MSDLTPNSRRLAILMHLRETLQGMTDTTLYHFPIKSAKSVSLDPTMFLLDASSVDQPTIVIEPTPEGNKDYYPSEQLREIFRVNIHERVDADAADQLSRIKTLEHIAADLETALQADTTRGGLATDTRLGVAIPWVSLGSNACILMQPVEVRIYRAYRNGQ